MSNCISSRAATLADAMSTLRISFVSSPAFHSSRQFTTSPTGASKVKFKVKSTLPPGWKYTGTDPVQNRKAYNVAMAEYREKVAVLRNAWRPLVDKHREELAKRKAQRDAARLQEQAANLDRQFARWKNPSSLRTSREIRSDPDARAAAYARHAHALHIAHVSRAAQAQLLLQESPQWVREEEVDAAIARALDSPEDLYAEAAEWKGGLEGIPEFVEGFEGPQVEQKLPEHVVRARQERREGRRRAQAMGRWQGDS